MTINNNLSKIKYQRPKNANYIDLIKVIAMLCVFMLHTTIFDDTSFISDTNLTFLFKPSAWAGVWIFFFCSSYLLGKSYFTNYSFNAKSVIKFYYHKFITIVIPTIIFILSVSVLSYPSFIKNIPTVLIKLLTFRYIGNPGVNGLAATWYISTFLCFIILAPFVCYIVKNLSIKSKTIILVFFIVSGFLYRYYAFHFKLDWNKQIYTPAYANLDLFICGILLSSVASEKFKWIKKIWLKPVILTILFLTIIFNCWINYKNYFIFHTMVLPTVYLCILILYFFVLSSVRLHDNIFSYLIKKLSDLNFGFYLFHSLILDRLSKIIVTNIKNLLVGHICLLLIAGGISLIFSYGFNKIFRRKS